MSDNIRALLNKVRTPVPPAARADTRNQGVGIEYGEHLNENLERNTNIAIDDEDDYDMFVGETEGIANTFHVAAEWPAPTDENITPLGTSTNPVSIIDAKALFIHTSQVEDTEVPMPTIDQVNSSELISARSTNTSITSVSWGDSNTGQAAGTKFGIFVLPYDTTEFSYICGKKIGNGAKMCIKRNCMISHRRGGERAKIEPGEIRVQKNLDEAFLEPVTKNSYITEEVLEQWKGTRKRIDEWVSVFALANATDYHEVLSPTEMRQGAAYVDHALSHKTLGMNSARRFEKSTNTFANLLTQGSIGSKGIFTFNRKRSSSDEELDDEGKVGSRRKLSDELSIHSEGSNKESKLQASIDHLYGLLHYLAEELDKKDEVASEEIKILFSRIDLVKIDLGSRVSGRLDKYEAPTIWGSIAVLSGVLEDMQRDIDRVPTSADLKKSLTKEVERLEAKALNTVNGILSYLGTKIAALTATNDMKSKNCEKEVKNINQAFNAAQVSTQEILFDLAQGASVLKDEIEALRRQLRITAQRQMNSASGGNCSNYVRIPVYDTKVAFIDTKMDKMQEQITMLISDADSESIKSFGLGFRDRKSSEVWLDLNLPNDFGLIVDVHLVFEHLNNMMSDNDECTLKALYVMHKLQLKNKSQGLCITSFDVQIPKLLSKSINAPSFKTKGAPVSYFDRVESYARWDDPNLGTRELIREHLKTFERSHQDQIDACTADDSKGRNIATQALTVSVGWIHLFIAFLDDTYKGFMSQRTFTEARAWELTTQLGRRVFAEVSVPRNGINTFVSIGELQKINKLVFWPTLRSLDIMKAYKDANFKHHPTMSSEYVKFLVANSGSEVIGTLAGKLEKMEIELANTIKALKVAEKNAVNALNAADELKKRMSDLEKKFLKR